MSERTLAGGQFISGEVAQLIRLIEDNDPAVTEVNLGGRELSPAAFRALCEALKRNVTLDTVFLFDVGVGPTYLQLLMDALQVNRTLSCVNLGENNILAQGAELVILLLQQVPSLNQLYLDHWVTNDAQRQEIKKLLSPEGRARVWFARLGRVPPLPSQGVGHHAGFRGALSERAASSFRPIFDADGNAHPAPPVVHESVVEPGDVAWVAGPAGLLVPAYVLEVGGRKAADFDARIAGLRAPRECISSPLVLEYAPHSTPRRVASCTYLYGTHLLPNIRALLQARARPYNTHAVAMLCVRAALADMRRKEQEHSERWLRAERKRASAAAAAKAKANAKARARAAAVARKAATARGHAGKAGRAGATRRKPADAAATKTGRAAAQREAAAAAKAAPPPAPREPRSDAAAPRKRARESEDSTPAAPARRRARAAAEGPHHTARQLTRARAARR